MRIKYKIILTLVILLIFIVIYFVKTQDTVSKFNTSMQSNALGGIAFYIIEPGYQNREISLDNIIPSNNLYEYEFSVANYNATKRLETNAKYNIILRTTTNLNLQYYLYENNGLDDILIDKQYIQDSDGTYFYIMKTNEEYFGFTSNQINNYKLKIKFPIEYISSVYQDILESIEIIIKSEQIVE